MLFFLEIKKIALSLYSERAREATRTETRVGKNAGSERDRKESVATT